MAKSALDIILKFIKQGSAAEDGARELNKLDESQTKAKTSANQFSLAESALSERLIGAGRAMLQQVPALIDLGINYNQSRVALEAYAGSAFEAQNFIDAVTESTGHSIDQLTATQAATRLLSLGLADTAEQAGNLARVAVTLGATMGKDAAPAMEEFNLLLANQSLLRLDTYGVSAAKVRERMAELSAEFPEMDRNARFVNATLEIANQRLEELDAAGFQATSSLDRLRAFMDDAKLAAGEWLADGLLPIIDGLFGVADASEDLRDEIFKNSESFEEYQENLKEAGRVGGFFSGQTKENSEELFNQAKAAEAAAAAAEELEAAEAGVALTVGGLNELLGEQELLMSALSAGLSGPISKGAEKYQDALADAASAQSAMITGQAELDSQLAAGEITQDQYTKGVEKLESAWIRAEEKSESLQKSLARTTRELIFQQAAAELDAETSLLLARELGLIDEASFAVAQQAQKMRLAFDEGAIGAEEFAEHVGDLAAEVDDFNAADRELNVDTLASSQAVQRFENRINQAAIATGGLQTKIGALQSKTITITANTSQAESGLTRVVQFVGNIPARKTIEVTTVNRTLGAAFGSGASSGAFRRAGFQQGGQFTIPEAGPLGDNIPVSFMAERGETVTVTPRGRSPRSGRSGGGVLIQNVNMNSRLDLAMLGAALERLK